MKYEKWKKDLKLHPSLSSRFNFEIPEFYYVNFDGVSSEFFVLKINGAASLPDQTRRLIGGNWMSIRCLLITFYTILKLRTYIKNNNYEKII